MSGLVDAVIAVLSRPSVCEVDNFLKGVVSTILSFTQAPVSVLTMTGLA